MNGAFARQGELYIPAESTRGPWGETELGEEPEAERRDDDVGPAGEGEHELGGPRPLWLDRDAPLPRLEGELPRARRGFAEVDRRPAARDARALHLHDVGAHLREHL